MPVNPEEKLRESFEKVAIVFKAQAEEMEKIAETISNRNLPIPFILMTMYQHLIEREKHNMVLQKIMKEFRE